MKFFREEQRFTQTWLMIVLGISTIVSVLLIVNEYSKENTTMSTNEFVFLIFGVFLSIGFIFFFKLKTSIDSTGIHYQFFPIHFSIKTIPWSEINSAQIRKYNAISEYGGWGVKGGNLWNKNKGKAINVSGNIGIQLELKNGKKLLIGSQKKEELKRVLARYQSKIKIT